MSEPRFRVRKFMIIGLIGLAILLGGFGSWSVFANISGAVIASGAVEVEQNRQIVQHPDGGIVAEILVDEGDFVEVGAPLIRLDAAELQSSLTVTESQLFEVVARLARWEAERDGLDEIVYGEELVSLASGRPELQDLIDGQSRLFVARRETLSREVEQLGKRREQIETQIDGFDAQIVALDEQLVLLSKELEDQQSLLRRELTQATRVFGLQRELANLQGRRGELIAGRAQAGERITEIEIEILKLNSTLREEAITRLRDLQVRELELSEERRTVTTRLERLEITAPVAGIIYDKQVFAPRSVIRAAEPVMFLIPQDRPLVVAAQVAPIHVDQVFVGQDVVIRFSAFDARTTPELFGSVVQVSADAFVDEVTQAAYYRVEVRLPEEELSRLPEGLVMVPGMPVEAFIATDARTPLTYLVRPLTDYFARAFRES